MALPHVRYLEERPLDEVVSEFLGGRPGEVFLAVSEDFVARERRERQDQAYQTLEGHFCKLASALQERLGPPSFVGRAGEEGYPEWAEGESVVVWAEAERPCYLRLQQEEREVPIVVALAPAPKNL
jgi:hypothetical protein